MLLNPKYASAADERESENSQFPGFRTAISGLRYYSPSLGRFINRDPSEEQGGLNLYAFCSNNGVNAWDYLGMWDEKGNPSNGAEGFELAISRWRHFGESAFIPSPNNDAAAYEWGAAQNRAAALARLDYLQAKFENPDVLPPGSTYQYMGNTYVVGSGGDGYGGYLDGEGLFDNNVPNRAGPAGPVGNITTPASSIGARPPDIGPDGVRYVGPMMTESDPVGTAIETVGNVATVAGLVADAGGDLRHNAYFWRQANGKWRIRNAASEANYLLNRSYNLAGARTAIWKTASARIGVAGLVISIADIGHNGLNWRNGADLAFGLIGFAGPVGTAVSSTYAVATLSWDIYDAMNPTPTTTIRDPDP